jgi:hypothetical protein
VPKFKYLKHNSKISLQLVATGLEDGFSTTEVIFFTFAGDGCFFVASTMGFDPREFETSEVGNSQNFGWWEEEPCVVIATLVSRI